MRKSVTSDKRMPQRLNDGRLDELDQPYVDIYIQEFFLHCFSLLTKERQKFVESKEGYTYLTMQMEETVTMRILSFVPP